MDPTEGGLREQEGEVVRERVVRAMLVWAGLSVVGVAIVAVPDAGPRVVTLSETHGPSALDLVGMAPLLLGWAVFLSALWHARSAVRVPPWPTALAAAVATAVLAWSVVTDTGWWWLVAAGALLAIQVGAGLSVTAVAGPGAEAGRARDGHVDAVGGDGLEPPTPSV